MDRCFACGKPLKAKTKALVYTRDGQSAYVGPDCYTHTLLAGSEGYQPPLGGPRLFCK